MCLCTAVKYFAKQNTPQLVTRIPSWRKNVPKRELLLENGYRLAVYEILTWDADSLLIQRYSYEIWRGREKLYWYDPQTHPDEPSLASTYPHHKHVIPNIKHNRIPCPGCPYSLQSGVTHAPLSKGGRVISNFFFMRLSYIFNAFPSTIGW